MFELLLDIVPKMINDAVVEFLAEKVKELTPKDVDDVTLDFLVNVTLMTAKNFKSLPLLNGDQQSSTLSDNPFRRNFGLYLIWRLTLNKSNVTPEFRMRVYGRLRKLVLSQSFQDDRYDFVTSISQKVVYQLEIGWHSAANVLNLFGRTDL